MNRLSPEIHPSLNPDIIKELFKRKIHTSLDLVRAIKTDRRTVEKITTLSLKEIIDLNKHLLKSFGPTPKNAFDQYQEIISQSAILQTNIQSIDSLLDGGLFTGYIYEICGLPATGKTFFCLSLMKNVLTTAEDSIYYIDTKHDFCAVAFRKMLQDFSREQVVQMMTRLFVARVYNRPEFFNALFHLQAELQKKQTFKLLIIDSLPILYFQSIDHTENNNFLNFTINTLNYMVKECNIVVVITNLMTVWNDGNFKNTDTMKERLSCGSFWYNAPNVRLKFEKDKDICCISLVKALKAMPSVTTCKVKFTDTGFV